MQDSAKILFWVGGGVEAVNVYFLISVYDFILKVNHFYYFIINDLNIFLENKVETTFFHLNLNHMSYHTIIKIYYLHQTY